MKLSLDEVRRLTGPNLLSEYPGAIADVFISDTDCLEVVSCWQTHLQECLLAVGWQQQSYFRLYDGGASLSVSAPMDLLYSACDLLELAWDCCVDEISGTQVHNKIARLQTLRDDILKESNPALIKLLEAAEQHGVLCLPDDDELSLGTGTSSQTWTIDKLPALENINWQQYQQIPLALITGTNGKSTSVRLAAEIAMAAGLQAGVTSTDFIKVGDAIIDRGDYSGPGGARMLLRDKRTEIAFLEVARGGLLRRGLPVKEANVSLVTNVASDHLGQYGINTVDEIAHVKLMVAKAIRNKNSLIVLNADDERLVKFVPECFPKDQPIPVCWFSLDANNALIQNHIRENRPCVYRENGFIIYHHESKHKVAEIDLVPMTVNSTAMHNVQNALGVVGLCKTLGISSEAIQSGLMSFGSNAADNPGRTNVYDVNGITVIVDFAHNAHSMKAVMDMAKNMAKTMPNDGTISVMFSHGGDRSNKEIFDVADAVRSINPSSYILCELETYLRGRDMGEISDLVETYLLEKGIPAAALVKALDPIDGAQKALNVAKAGDLVLLFVLDKREQVDSYLTNFK
jgi:cyanophycin synthetase